MLIRSEEAQECDSEPCPTCGHKPHPLKAVRHLPPGAQEAFPVIETKPAPKRRKTVPFARVITSEEIMQQIQKKDEKDKETKKVILFSSE